jgi:segregation and condensation protein B
MGLTVQSGIEGPDIDAAGEGAAEIEARMAEAARIVEALLFASAEPIGEADIAPYLSGEVAPREVLARLEAAYAPRGVNLVRVAGKWALRTAEDLGHLLSRRVEEPKRLTRAALETLSIIAYHQPVTRAEIEEIRGVATSKGTLDTLLEASLIRLRGRRRTPGRPLTYGTTPAFLEQFGLDRVDDLPGLEDLKGAGFIEGRVPKDLAIPTPSDDATLRDDEDPLEDLFAPREPDDDGEGDALGPGGQGG